MAFPRRPSLPPPNTPRWCPNPMGGPKKKATSNASRAHRTQPTLPNTVPAQKKARRVATAARRGNPLNSLFPNEPGCTRFPPNVPKPPPSPVAPTCPNHPAAPDFVQPEICWQTPPACTIPGLSRFFQGPRSAAPIPPACAKQPPWASTIFFSWLPRYFPTASGCPMLSPTVPCVRFFAWRHNPCGTLS